MKFSINSEKHNGRKREGGLKRVQRRGISGCLVVESLRDDKGRKLTAEGSDDQRLRDTDLITDARVGAHPAEGTRIPPLI